MTRMGEARNWVQAWWKGGGGTFGKALNVMSLPLEWGFRRVISAWGGAYDRGWMPLQRAPIPVISVGNLTVGGTGKTPFSAWLVTELRARGLKPALVARGYGEDEMALHRRWNPGLPVIADEDRAFGAWRASRKGANVVVLDDAFQHRRLARSLDIVLVSKETPVQVKMLPRGPFREPLDALRRADVVVVVEKGTTEEAVPPLDDRLRPFLAEAPVRARFEPGDWVDLWGKPAEAPEGDFLALAGVGDPESASRVFHQATGRQVELVAYPDHHEYSPTDVSNILAYAGGRSIVTTEKDGVKLEDYREAMEEVRVLKLKLEITNGEERFWDRVLTIAHA